jgi:hypothetical protein
MTRNSATWLPPLSACRMTGFMDDSQVVAQRLRMHTMCSETGFLYRDPDVRILSSDGMHRPRVARFGHDNSK